MLWIWLIPAALILALILYILYKRMAPEMKSPEDEGEGPENPPSA